MESPIPVFSLILESQQHPKCLNRTLPVYYHLMSLLVSDFKLKLLKQRFQKQMIVSIYRYLSLSRIYIHIHTLKIISVRNEAVFTP